jgi:hypothetical protein
VCNIEQTNIFQSHTIPAQTPSKLILSALVNGFWGASMACRICGSGNEQEFTAEINIHFCGLKNINNPSVLVFPKVVVCLNCGMSRFTINETKLALLASSPQTGAPSEALENFDRIATTPTNASESLKRGDETAA